MLCEKCHQRPVTGLFFETIDGQEMVRRLCEVCATLFLDRYQSMVLSRSQATSLLFSKALERPADCPSEVSITDPISLQDLAKALHARVVQVVAVLLEQNVFPSPKTLLTFETASLVCARYEVTPHRVMG
jgi:hypothetical protein